MCRMVKILKNFQVMLIKPINKNNINKGRKEREKDGFTSQISPVDTSGRLTEEYLDRYKGVR